MTKREETCAATSWEVLWASDILVVCRLQRGAAATSPKNMAVLCKLSRYSKSCRSLKLNSLVLENSRNREFRTVVQEPKSRGLLKLSLISGGVGALVGVGYALQKIRRDRENLALDGKEIEIGILKHKPPVQPSRRVSAMHKTICKWKKFRCKSLTMPGSKIS